MSNMYLQVHIHEYVYMHASTCTCKYIRVLNLEHALNLRVAERSLDTCSISPLYSMVRARCHLLPMYNSTDSEVIYTKYYYQQ